MNDTAPTGDEQPVPPQQPSPPQYAPPEQSAAQPPAQTPAQPASPQYAPPPQYTPPPQYAPPPQYTPPGQYAPPQQQQQPQQYTPPQQPPAPSYPGPTYVSQPEPGYPHPGQQYPGQQYPGPVYGALENPGPGGSYDGAADANDLSRPLYGANIGQALARFFKNYAAFSGRASRSEFWWVTLAAFGVSIVLSIVVAIVEDTAFYSYGSYELLTGLLGFVYFAIWAGTFIPWLAISWRRLHDANFAGPLFFITFFPLFGPIALLILFILPSKVEGRRFMRSQ